MSTRSTAHFVEGERTVAIVYRHSDGYPSEAGADILEFFEEVRKQTKDTRFNDPSYLAAKYVVFLAKQFAHTYGKLPNGEWGYTPSEPLDFLSVGVCLIDPGDIEYRYLIDCSRMIGDPPRPHVEVEEIGTGLLGEVADVLASGTAE